MCHFTRGTRIEMERSKAELCGARIRAAYPKSEASHPQNLLTLVVIATHPSAPLRAGSVKPPPVGHPVHVNLVGKMVGGPAPKIRKDSDVFVEQGFQVPCAMEHAHDLNSAFARKVEDDVAAKRKAS